MKFDKKLINTIIGNTIMFIAVLLFVALFRSVFGEENTIVGVSVLVLSLALLSRDLTKKPLKNFIFLLVFDAITIFGAYIFQSHLWLGLILNFTIIASICYLFTYEVKNPLNMLFGLQYVLLIGSPISAAQLPRRIMGAFVGACFIITLQLLVNRNKLAKSSKNTLSLIEENMLLKINLIKEKKSTEAINITIDGLLNSLKSTIFESGQDNFKMNAYGEVSIDVLSSIEKVNILLDKIEGKDLNAEIFSDIYEQLENVKNGNFDSTQVNNILAKYESDMTIVNEFLNAFEILQVKIKEFKVVAQNTGDDLGKDIHIPDEFELGRWHKNNLKKMSYRAAYGIRVGILFALTGFITKLFNLEFGKWMMFTVFALTQPYAEFSVVKTKKRIFGTTIGAIIIFVAFLIIKDSAGRMMMLLIAGYFFAFAKDYKYTAILITICATTIDAMNHTNPYYVILSRGVFVLIGVIISLIANKFLLRREYKDAEASLTEILNDSSHKILEEVFTSYDTNENSIRNLVLIPSLVETRAHNLGLNINKPLLKMKKVLVNDIYQVHLIGMLRYKVLMKDVSNIIKNNMDLNSIEKSLNEYSEGKKDLREKSLIIIILKILKDTNELKS